MYGPRINVTFDRGSGPTELELGPIRDEVQAAKHYVEWLNDNRVRAFLIAPRPITLSHEQDWIRDMNSDQGSITWAVYSDGALVGSIGMFDIDRRHARAELGILIGDRASWGRGIATAVEAAAVEYVFNNVIPGGLNKVIARVIEGNEASRRALETVGFQTVGMMRKDRWSNGRWYDSWLAELLREDWAAIREERFAAAGVTYLHLYPGCDDIGLTPVCFGEEGVRTR